MTIINSPTLEHPFLNPYWFSDMYIYISHQVFVASWVVQTVPIVFSRLSGLYAEGEIESSFILLMRITYSSSTLCIKFLSLEGILHLQESRCSLQSVVMRNRGRMPSGLRALSDFIVTNFFSSFILCLHIFHFRIQNPEIASCRNVRYWKIKELGRNC